MTVFETCKDQFSGNYEASSRISAVEVGNIISVVTEVYILNVGNFCVGTY